jgi:hypothetical protein
VDGCRDFVMLWRHGSRSHLYVIAPYCFMRAHGMYRRQGKIAAERFLAHEVE